MTVRKLIESLELLASRLGDETTVFIATSYRDSDDGRQSLEDDIVGIEIIPAVESRHWPEPPCLKIVGDECRWLKDNK